MYEDKNIYIKNLQHNCLIDSKEFKNILLLFNATWNSLNTLKYYTYIHLFNVCLLDGINYNDSFC